MDIEKLNIIENNTRKVKKLIEDVAAIESFISVLEKEKHISISDGCDHLSTNCNLYELIGVDFVEVLNTKLNKLKNIVSSINENNLSNESLFR